MQGLFYRYFDSKQKLFREAMDRYVAECCAAALPVIHDRSRTIRQRLDAMAALALETEEHARYWDFYHRAGNQALHEQLSEKMCGYLIPHVTEEFREACARGELALEYPELTAGYLLHAQVGLMGESDIPLDKRMEVVRRYADLILNGG